MPGVSREWVVVVVVVVGATEDSYILSGVTISNDSVASTHHANHDDNDGIQRACSRVNWIALSKFRTAQRIPSFGSDPPPLSIKSPPCMVGNSQIPHHDPRRSKIPHHEFPTMFQRAAV